MIFATKFPGKVKTLLLDMEIGFSYSIAELQYDFLATKKTGMAQ